MTAPNLHTEHHGTLIVVTLAEEMSHARTTAQAERSAPKRRQVHTRGTPRRGPHWPGSSTATAASRVELLVETNA